VAALRPQPHYSIDLFTGGTMDRFRNILVVVDDTGRRPAALARAAALARRHGARVTAVHAMKGRGDHEMPAFDGISACEVQRIERETCVEELAEAVAAVRAEGVDADARLLVGTPFPFIEIIREVIRGGYDLVIKDARPPHGLVERFFSSLDLHLLRKCPVPVWILKPDERARPGRVVAAVDPDTVDPEHERLNGVILDLAASVARQDGGELHVVHAWRLFGENAFRSHRFRLPAARLDAMIEQERARRAALVEALVDEYRTPDFAVAVHLIKGEPGEVLPAALRHLRADLVVMGTVARTGVPGFIIGNTAETVLGEVACSVLAVKPSGFESPVRLPDAVAGSGAAMTISRPVGGRAHR